MNNKIISPLNDFVFKEVFGNQENISNTKAFLKALLDIPEEDYDKLTVETPNLKRLSREDKMGIVDLKLSTKSNRIIHIELQVKKSKDLKSRILFYAARLFGEQLKKGEKYENLYQVISILICDHVLLEEEKSYINEYELRNRENHSFTDLVKLVILELPKLPEQDETALWPWLKLFKCENAEEYEMLTKDHPEVKEAVITAKKVSFGDRWRWSMLLRQKHKIDEQMILEAAKDDARAEGHAEGRAAGHAEGHAESKFEIARKLKSRGRPLTEIAEDTGLSPEEIARL